MLLGLESKLGLPDKQHYKPWRGSKDSPKNFRRFYRKPAKQYRLFSDFDAEILSGDAYQITRHAVILAELGKRLAASRVCLAVLTNKTNWISGRVREQFADFKGTVDPRVMELHSSFWQDIQLNRVTFPSLTEYLSLHPCLRMGTNVS